MLTQQQNFHEHKRGQTLPSSTTRTVLLQNNPPPGYDHHFIFFKNLAAMALLVGMYATLPLLLGADSFSLVPTKLSTAPHYYTTWATQGYMPGDGWTSKNLTVDWIFGHQGSYQDATLNSNYLFGQPGLMGSGWVRDFFPQSRAELYFMLDEGYATSIDSIEVNPKHFPEFNQSNPSDRLVAFQHKVMPSL